MKKFVSVLMIISMVFSSFTLAHAENAINGDFAITSDGEITAYYGGEWVVVPEKIGDIPVVKIGEQAFFDLGIFDAYLPEGLLTIGRSAFEGSTVTSVDIPTTVSLINERAFANCQSLSTIFLGCNEDVTIEKDAFSGTNHLSFYVNCTADGKELDEKLYKAKGNYNYEIHIRHTASGYDEEGNTVCTACNYKEIYPEGDLPFTDVPRDSWYYDYVHTAYLNSIINGKTNTTFEPNAGMTCAEAAKIAACINAIFSDPVPEHTYGPWYQPYVDYCYEQGLIEEYVVFDWNKPITRAQMAYIFSHCIPWEYNINNVPITDIPDVYEDTPFAYYILNLYNKGIAVGDETKSFHPNSNIKRSEVAAIIARIIDWNMRIELPKG